MRQIHARLTERYFENSQPEPRVFHSISVQAKSPARPTQVETQKCPQLIQAQTSALQLSISDSSANPSHQEGCPFHPTLLRRGLALVGSQTSNVHRGTVNHLRGSTLDYHPIPTAIGGPFSLLREDLQLRSANAIHGPVLGRLFSTNIDLNDEQSFFDFSSSQPSFLSATHIDIVGLVGAPLDTLHGPRAAYHEPRTRRTLFLSSAQPTFGPGDQNWDRVTILTRSIEPRLGIHSPQGQAFRTL
ncbi:hypothetical protein CC2G_000101 [Coprinopsis cinerea AmutBmut pab1-1]|nr:hypothetical protein CC2G_000101 [Coprinopsis cinerea AmutBmut pab1-1]